MLSLIVSLLLLCVSSSCVLGQQCSSSYCNSGQTCCVCSDGTYGCCNLVNAICCSDGLHCCPSGYHCDLQSSSCIANYLDMDVKIQMTPVNSKVGLKSPLETCPTGTCPDSMTCCSVGGGQYGCCPFVNATCCSDDSHCCPDGYHCDLTKGLCVMSDTSIHFTLAPLYLPFPTISIPLIPATTTSTYDAMRASSSSCNCDSNFTCCSNGAGGWLCCPLQQATCCADMKSCCPDGYVCDIGTTSCIHSTTMKLWKY